MNCFETIEKDGLIIRNLNISDLGAYMDLFNKLGTNMFGVDLTNYGGAIETLASSKLMSSNNITRGVFENGKLILTVGSFYKDTFNSWYEHSHYSAIKQDFNKWCTAHYYAIVPLFDYYESLGYFSYYTRRSLADQRKWRKIDKMKIFANVPEYRAYRDRYTHDVEAIYTAESECTMSNHMFYFSWRKSFPENTVIVKHSLTHENRMRLLNNKFPELVNDPRLLQSK